jgi:Family of unknown function (DUF5677)
MAQSGIENFFPLLPNFDEALLSSCDVEGDFRPILFELYKYVGLLAHAASRVSIKSEAVVVKDKRAFTAVKGLMHRMCRLMLANVALSHEGLYGETTLIVDRCIVESGVIVSWIVKCKNGDEINRYLASGLKAELELQREIETRISKRSGLVLPIEERMLKGIEATCKSAGLNSKEVEATKKMPPFPGLIQALGLESLQDVVLMKMGSHAVHGTWPSLLVHYLEPGEDGELQPRDSNVETEFEQYSTVALRVLFAIKDWSNWSFGESDENTAFQSKVSETEKEIWKFHDLAALKKDARRTQSTV